MTTAVRKETHQMREEGGDIVNNDDTAVASQLSLCNCAAVPQDIVTTETRASLHLCLLLAKSGLSDNIGRIASDCIADLCLGPSLFPN